MDEVGRRKVAGSTNGLWPLGDNCWAIEGGCCFGELDRVECSIITGDMPQWKWIKCLRCVLNAEMCLNQKEVDWLKRKRESGQRSKKWKGEWCFRSTTQCCVVLCAASFDIILCAHLVESSILGYRKKEVKSGLSVCSVWIGGRRHRHYRHQQ